MSRAGAARHWRIGFASGARLTVRATDHAAAEARAIAIAASARNRPRIVSIVLIDSPKPGGMCSAGLREE
ncbi:hypothetical protein [Paracoccus sp. NSM]|uniref:hypothetical protein n=1 Tax=Paracoccus sp. NSM TaxID=3457784 RepID=UPI00403720AB